jgi:protein-ribulosamine 3-kinase
MTLIVSSNIQALELDASSTTLVAHGGSGFVFTSKLTGRVDGIEKQYFVKTGMGKESELIFAGNFH